MSDLRELYQEVILDHHKKPRNFRELEGARHVEGFNPLCGDRVTVYLKLEGDVVPDVSFQGTGCAISTASASMMTESLKGKTRAEAEALSKLPRSGHGQAEPTRTSNLGKLPFSPACASFRSASSAPPWPGTPSMPRWKVKRKRSRRSEGRFDIAEVLWKRSPNVCRWNWTTRCRIHFRTHPLHHPRIQAHALPKPARSLRI